MRHAWLLFAAKVRVHLHVEVSGGFHTLTLAWALGIKWKAKSL